MHNRRRLAIACLLLPLTAASGGCHEEPGQDEAHSTVIVRKERPWEVSTEQGEMVLPNLFYAEASENEQIMPTAIDGRNLIDRLVYPTIGNPNLYVKSDAADSLMLVLRVEPELLAPLGASEGDKVANAPRRYLELDQDADNRLAFYLVPRAAREANTAREGVVAAGAPGVIAIDPSDIQIHDVADGLPEAFQRRRTLRVMFRESAMAAVPAGLYDLRVELLHDGAIATAAEGNTSVFEYQYNAVRVFDADPAGGDYTVLNVTDTQVSVGSKFQDKNQPQLRSFVQYVNSTGDPDVRDAAFITFNGDLHHGGSPGGLREGFVAKTYLDETRVILDSLKELTLPIFLTPGNHDGYVSIGHVPPDVEEFSKHEGLKNAINEAWPKAWPDFDWDSFKIYRDVTFGAKGGLPRDVFVGAHQRSAEGKTFANGWTHLPREDRNMVLYDGFHHWQRSYGPLNFSWSFGDNHYVSLNSFELRQHRRSGWGMYTVNYGGGVSDVQLEWTARELDHAEKSDKDVVLIAHHDPRGGHKGHDHGYYYEQIEYRGIGQSALNYLNGSVLLPVLCKLPSWALKDSTESDCLHDGLQDWMRPDPTFDCRAADRQADGTCDPAVVDPASGRSPYFSGLELVEQIATHPRVRTMLLGHTHYHSLEVLAEGAEMVPEGFQLSHEEEERFAALEVANPVRGYAWQGETPEYDPDNLDVEQVASDNAWFFAVQRAAAQKVVRHLQGAKRELAILRLTSNAALTRQKYNDESMIGFSVLHMHRKDDARGYAEAQLNEASYYLNVGSGVFEPIASVGIERTLKMTTDGPTNPVDALFE